MTDPEKRIRSGTTVRAFIFGIGFSAYFAWATVMRENFPPHSLLSVNALPVLPYVGLFLLALLINPLLRRIRGIQALSMGEMLLIFSMCSVTAGVATFGLAAPVIPRISGLNNRDNNNDQTQWARYVMPYLNENYFIAVKGTRAAAIKYRDACNAYDRARTLHRTARDILTARDELARIQKEKERIAAIAEPALREAEAKTLLWPEQQAQKLMELSKKTWDKLAGDDLKPALVADTYESKVERLRAERDRLAEELKELNEKAYAAVDLVRKGLPEEQRAIPGIFYSKGEGWASYKARMRRARVGTQARKRLVAARDQFADVGSPGGWQPEKLAGELEAVAATLAPLSDIPVLAARKNALTAEVETLEKKLQAQRVKARNLRHLRRFAEQDQFGLYDEKINRLEASIEELDSTTTGIRETLEKRLLPPLAACDRVVASRNMVRELAEKLREGNVADPARISSLLTEQVAAFRGFDASYRRYFFGDIDWGLWARPVTNWVVLIFLVYVILMSFNTLIYRQWSYNEKVIYPIAEATTVLAAGGDPDADQGQSIYKSGLFWIGFSIAFGILGWNHLAQTGMVPNISPIKLQTLWYGYVGNGVFKGLGSTYFCIIFAVIGLSFLVPSKISLSLWGFEGLYMVMLMVMAWMGYGNNRWQMGNPGRAGMGSGAAWIFGLMILWTCRKYIFCLFRPKGIQKLPEDEQKELRWSSAAFLGAFLILFLILVFRLDVGPYNVIKWFMAGIITTIVIVRAVCEAGVLGVEGGVQGIPFLMDSAPPTTTAAANAAAQSSAHLMIPGVALGMKAFIAPVMANMLKIREDIPGRRLTFHAAVWCGLIVATFIALVTLIMISYDNGANSLFGWTNTAIPKWTFNDIKEMAIPKDAQNVKFGWWLTGAILMGLLLFSRQKFFGVPHPIGLVMLMNPVMFGFWGSVMLGWLFKSLASKYCNKKQYLSIRCFFIGLIVGHLVAAVLGWDRMEWHWG